MELGTAIIAISIILACIIPFVLISRSNKKKELQFLQALSDLSENSDCKISKYDVWNNAAIGADEALNMIFFIKKSGDHETQQQINLAKVEKCTVVNTSRTINSNSGDLKVIDKLELSFSSSDKNQSETVMVLYDANSDSLTLSGELQLVEKWCKIANDTIGALKQRK